MKKVLLFCAAAAAVVAVLWLAGVLKKDYVGKFRMVEVTGEMVHFTAPSIQRKPPANPYKKIKLSAKREAELKSLLDSATEDNYVAAVHKAVYINQGYMEMVLETGMIVEGYIDEFPDIDAFQCNYFIIVVDEADNLVEVDIAPIPYKW